MRFAHLAACAATIVAAGLATPSHAQPLLTSGIGLQSCEKLGPELKPADGLNHPPNYLLYYWVQGYISAATILKLIAEFCKENPDKQPISAIDKFIRDADKVEARESDAFDPWEH